MATFQPADNLRSRTFLGLLAAQFLAAFNDQAIHASSMFFAINQNALSKDAAISLMPILFYAPWALFCTLAGYLADRYSKWNSLVFWKFAEIGITLIALLGFWLGTNEIAAGPYLVLSTVFLMGTHSAFFVPAKYGAMPEILQPHMLSRGNGLLESLSFLAVILGTVMGGVLSQVFRGEEYYIGLILVGLAVLGALASLLIRRMPAANPTRPFPPYLYQPLWQSIRGLLRSRPLAVSVLGIAFFTFIVAFMRSTMYMHGQTRVPQWDEAKTSEVVGMVALGIGLGSPLVGFLSGGKVELGLVPIGAVGMIVATLVAALSLDHLNALIVSITLIGFFTGFYIVPLFTLLQYRAPKTSKGDAVATSNFINVTGAIIASVLFYVLVAAAHVSGITPKIEQKDRFQGRLKERPQYAEGKPVRVVIELKEEDKPVRDRIIRANAEGKKPRSIQMDEDLIDSFGPGLSAGDEVIESTYRIGSVTHHTIRRADRPQRQIYDESSLPRLLFVGAALMTLLTLLLLWRQMPDLFTRTWIWLRTQRSFRLEIEGMDHLPDNGPVILLTNAQGGEACQHVASATDRTIRFFLTEKNPLANGTDAQVLEKRIEQTLAAGGVVGLSLDDSGLVERLLTATADKRPVPVLPVWYQPAPAPEKKRRRRIYILGGRLLKAGSSLIDVQAELQSVAEEFEDKVSRGEALKHVSLVGHD